MHIFATTLLIALGTAALAAMIVAADWDLAIVRTWQQLVAPTAPPVQEPMREPTPVVEPAAPILAEFSDADRAAAEEWLAAAAARCPIGH